MSFQCFRAICLSLICVTYYCCQFTLIWYAAFPFLCAVEMTVEIVNDNHRKIADLKDSLMIMIIFLGNDFKRSPWHGGINQEIHMILRTGGSCPKNGNRHAFEIYMGMADLCAQGCRAFIQFIVLPSVVATSSLDGKVPEESQILRFSRQYDLLQHNSSTSGWRPVYA